MKQRITFLIVCTLFLSTMAGWGQVEIFNEEIPGTTLRCIFTSDGVLTISSPGNVAQEIPNNVTLWDAYRQNDIKSVVIGDGVTRIGDNAFSICMELVSVVLPISVTSIGEFVFSDCDKLQPFDLKQVEQIERYSFRNCSNLTSVTIPATVTDIGIGAFSGCSKLTSVAIPASVTSIGEGAFSDCRQLVAVTVDISNTAYATVDGVLYNYAKDLLLYYPIGKTGATFTVLPTVEIIGSGAFSGNTNISTVNLPASLTRIGSGAFGNCTSLSSVSLPEGLLEIDEQAFYNTSLTSLSIPASVTYIQNMIVGYCSSLLSIDVDLANYRYSSVGGVLYSKDRTKLIAYPAGNINASFNIPEDVIIIGTDAFNACRNLTSVTIPESLTEIHEFAFSGCSALTSIDLKNVQTIRKAVFMGCGLTSIVIPEGVTAIEQSTFGGCGSLTSVVIPGIVGSIGYQAFGGCDALTNVTVYWANPLAITSDVFEYTDISSVALYVPKGTKTTYEGFSVWQDFGNIIEIGSEAIENEPSVAVGQSGIITLKLTASPGAKIVGTFKLTLATGFTLDADNCKMAGTLGQYYNLEIDNNPVGSQTWVFTITAKQAGSAAAARSMLAMLRADALLDFVTIAFNVGSTVTDGNYDMKLTDLNFDVTDGSAQTSIREAEIIVPVTVLTVPATSITISPASLSGQPGGTGTLTATILPADATDNVTWTSSNEAVAKVSTTGVVTYIAPGTATITATANSNVTATCTVTVTASPTPDPEPEPEPDPDLEDIYAAVDLIQFSIIQIPQEAGNTEADVRAWLAEYFRQQFNNLHLYVSVTDISFSLFEAAVAGSAANQNGTHGNLTFSAVFSKGSNSVQVSFIHGRILATPYIDTGNEAATQPTLKAVSDNGAIVVSGLTAGDDLQIYNAAGVLIYNVRKVEASELRIDVASGIYIVTSGNRTIKAIAR